MSLFVRVFNNFYAHRKTARLRAVLGNDALWIPPRLWSYASENQPDGDFSKYSSAEIALLIGYSGDATVMLQALLDSGFMDPGQKIHDWKDHNGYHATYVERAKKAAAARWGNRTRTGQYRKGQDRREALLGDAKSNACSINRKPSIEEVKLAAAKSGLPESEALKFFDYYESNGWRVGKNAMKSWPSALANWQRTWKERTYENPGRTGPKSVNRNAGTYNENRQANYDLRVVKPGRDVPNAQRPNPGANVGGG